MFNAGLTLIVISALWKLYDVIFTGPDPDENYLSQSTVTKIIQQRAWVDEHLEIVGDRE